MSAHRKDLRAVTVAMTIIAATLFLGFLMSALFKVAFMASNSNDESLKNTRAKFAALAGINRAFAELEKNPDWRTGWPNEEPLPQNPSLRYKLKVLDDVKMSQLGGVGDEKVASGDEEVYLFAQGFTQEGAGKPLAAMGGTAYRPGAAIAEACFADGDLSMDQGMSDGFDSRIGDHWYNPAETDAAKKTLLGLSGNVGGNRDIYISGATVDGNVVTPDPASFDLGGTSYGSPGNVDIGGATIKGKQETPDSPREVPEVVVPFDDDSATTVYDSSNFDTLKDSKVVPPPDTDPAKVLPPGAYATVSVPSGKTLELQSGVYYFKDSLSVSGATITLNGSGTVKVYVGSTLYASGSNISPSQTDSTNKNRKPSDLQFLFADKKEDPYTGEGYSEMVVQDSTVNAVAIGAKLKASMNNSEYFGAIQANKIRANSVNFHYDKALEDMEVENFSKWKLRGLTNLPPGTTL
jgi:hypothetical protein